MKAPEFSRLRNVHRTTPWHMDQRAIEHEMTNLRALAALGHGTRGDADRLADLQDELDRRIADFGPGSVVEMRIGREAPRLVLVDERVPDMKGGGPGFVGTYLTPAGVPSRSKWAGVWGFDRQVTRVVML